MLNEIRKILELNIPDQDKENQIIAYVQYATQDQDTIPVIDVFGIGSIRDKHAYNNDGIPKFKFHHLLDAQK